MASSPEYSTAGAVDTTAALATVPAPRSIWTGAYRFPLGQSILELPDDDAQLRNALLGIYLASGLNGVAVAWTAARAALEMFEKPSAAEEALTELKAGYGTGLEYSTSFAAFQGALLDANPGVASRSTLEESRTHNSDFRRRLLAAIDDILSAEEEAQRWYEDKLIQVIDAHLAHQKVLLKQAWESTYDVGRPDKQGPDGAVPIDGNESPAKLTIRNQSDLVEVKRYDKGANVQSATETIVKVPGVIAALHEVGTLYFKYKQELEGRIKANKQRQRNGAAALAIKDLSSYEPFGNALREHGAKHFIIWATFRRVIEDKAIETVFTQEMQDRCTRLIVDALRTAWKTCDEVSANAKADRLFKDEKPKCVVGRDELGIPASQIVTTSTYNRNQKTSQLYGVPYPRTSFAQQAGEISRSPWLQAPFHALILSAATAIQHEATPSSTADSVDHLKILFEGADDRKRLLALKALASFVSRAREEMIDTLLQRQERDEAWRRRIVMTVAGLGIAGTLFTGGASLVVAGIVDAFLVADKTSNQIAQWISAEQYSALVIDEMTAEAWREPAIIELMALVFEAGFHIAGDLVQEGAVAHFIASVGLTEMLAAGVGLASAALNKAGRTQ